MIDLKTCTPEEAYKHAKYVIKGRWVEAEHLILKDEVVCADGDREYFGLEV